MPAEQYVVPADARCKSRRFDPRADARDCFPQDMRALAQLGYAGITAVEQALFYAFREIMKNVGSAAPPHQSRLKRAEPLRFGKRQSGLIAIRVTVRMRN